MAYTTEEKQAMYTTVQTNLTNSALALKTFAEDEDLFVNGEPTQEQLNAGRDYRELSSLVGKYAIEAAANKA